LNLNINCHGDSLLVVVIFFNSSIFLNSSLILFATSLSSSILEELEATSLSHIALPVGGQFVRALIQTINQ